MKDPNRRGPGRLRRAIVAESANLLASGMSVGEVVAHIRENHGRSLSTAREIISVCHKEQARRISAQRSTLVARQNAKLEHAQKKAMARKIRGQSAPDVAGFVKAVVAQSKLLGLEAPKQVEVLERNLQDVLKGTVKVAFEFIRSDVDRAAFLERLREQSSGALKARRDPVTDAIVGRN